MMVSVTVLLQDDFNRGLQLLRVGSVARIQRMADGRLFCTALTTKGQLFGFDLSNFGASPRAVYSPPSGQGVTGKRSGPVGRAKVLRCSEPPA